MVGERLGERHVVVGERLEKARQMLERGCLDCMREARREAGERQVLRESIGAWGETETEKAIYTEVNMSQLCTYLYRVAWPWTAFQQ